MSCLVKPNIKTTPSFARVYKISNCLVQPNYKTTSYFMKVSKMSSQHLILIGSQNVKTSCLVKPYYERVFKISSRFETRCLALIKPNYKTSPYCERVPKMSRLLVLSSQTTKLNFILRRVPKIPRPS